MALQTYISKLYQIDGSGNVDRGITFYNVTGITDGVSITALIFKQPLQTSDNNIGMNLGGFSRLLSCNFILKSRGSSVATKASDISNNEAVTLSEQWEFLLRKIMQTPETIDIIGMRYRLVYYINDGSETATPMTFDGIVEDISVEPVEGETYLRGRLSMTEAGVNVFSS